MSVTAARVALRASFRPQRSVRSSYAPVRSRMASTQATSAAVSNAGRLSTIAAVAVAGSAIGAYAYNSKKPLRMDSNAEQSKRKSYSERSKPKIQRAQMTGGPSSSETQGARESEKQKESTRKPEPVNVTSYSGNTTGQQTEERSNKKNEEKEGDQQQKQDNARQSVVDSNTLPLDELENEASQESAFDPETNTINWDCPCLGGMAHGPCGDEFKEAFSCFVFSEKEPKGIECVEKFKGMQDCFRKYPEHYKEELEDDEAFESHEGETLEKKGEEHLSSKTGGDDDDEGVKEWRSELAKEGRH